MEENRKFNWELLHKIKSISQAFKKGDINPLPQLEDQIKEQIDSGELSLGQMFDIMCVLGL